MNDRPGSPRSSSSAKDHYSYTHYADRRVAEGFDALRFSGPIGTYLLETQERLLLDSLAPCEGQRMLDVGTGTARAALTLAKAGAVVTGVDASAQMLAVARARAAAAGLAIQFVPGDAHHLPFADGSFDAAICFRVIMHTPDWPRCVAELCRVTRRRLIIDFPARRSTAALESAARRLALAAGRRTEAYRVFSESAVRDVLRRGGFRVVTVHKQFVLPIAFHKAGGSLGLTRAVESGLAAIGLLRLFGSPITMVAER